MKADRFYALISDICSPAAARKQNNKQALRILAYTDSSTTERYACCTYIALNDTEGTFLHSGTDFYEQVTSTQAELLSILICVKYLADKYPGCKVSVFSDAQSIIELWNNNSQRLDRIIYADLFIDLQNMVKRFEEFNLVHVSAHSDMATPNKLCDLISRRYRRLHGFIVNGFDSDAKRAPLLTLSLGDTD